MKAGFEYYRAFFTDHDQNHFRLRLRSKCRSSLWVVKKLPGITC